MNRILTGLLLFLLLCGTIIQFPATTQAENDSGWDQVPEILKQIVKPTFPDRDFLVTDYGAKPDGKTDATQAFKEAIEAAHDAGGGRVVVPAGTYTTGAIHLKSNVNLHITKDATIKFSQDPKKYLPLVRTRWEGVELYNYSPLIYAYDQENIAISGEGTLDGQADHEHWWPWKGKKEFGWKEGQPHQAAGRDLLFEMAEKNVPVEERRFGEGYYLRPNFIQPVKSKNVLIEGVHIVDSPMWNIHPVLSENIIIDHVTVTGHGPNNDGIDPESSKNVWIKNSYFDNGDDCIAIKSGRNADGRRVNVPAENIIIQGNEMKDGHGGVVIGSEISGSVRNVYAENNRMDSPNLDRVLRIKTNSIRGGVVENIFLRDNDVANVGGEVVRVNMYYEEGDAGPYTPIVRNIEVKNLHSNGGNYGVWVRAYDRSPVQNLRIIDSSFNHVKTPMLIENVENMVLSNFHINGANYDNDPPTTTAEISGDTLSDGTFLNRAEVKLTAADRDGIEKIEYRSGDDSWRIYTHPIVIDQPGEMRVQYRAVDKTGNREPVQTASIKVIQTNMENLKMYVAKAEINPEGIRKALLTRIEEAERDFNKGDRQRGNKRLEQVKQYIEKQPEHHISKETKKDLVKVINHLMAD